MALIFVTAPRWSRAEFEVRAPLDRSFGPVDEVTPLELRVFVKSTQPLAMTHASVGGSYFSSAWQINADAYLKK